MTFGQKYTLGSNSIWFSILKFYISVAVLDQLKLILLGRIFYSIKFIDFVPGCPTPRSSWPRVYSSSYCIRNWNAYSHVWPISCEGLSKHVWAGAGRSTLWPESFKVSLLTLNMYFLTKYVTKLSILDLGTIYKMCWHHFWTLSPTT